MSWQLTLQKKIMYQGNPFSKNTISIDESSPPPILTEDKNILGIAIYPNEENYNARPQLNKINELLLKIHNPNSVKLFEVDYDSNLQQLPNLEKFQNIEYLHIAGRKIKEFDIISKLNKLKSLFLVNYKFKTIPKLNIEGLIDFRAIRGKLEIIDFSSECFEFQSCQKLIKFEKIKSKKVSIESCHNVNLESFANVDKLETLEIRGIKKLISLSFLCKCNELRELVITATNMLEVDTKVLNSTQNLKKCFFGQCSKKLLRKFAQDAPTILFSNGDISFKGDEQIDYSYYCDF